MAESQVREKKLQSSIIALKWLRMVHKEPATVQVKYLVEPEVLVVLQLFSLYKTLNYPLWSQ